MSNLGTPTKFATVWVLAACGIVLVGWDVYAALSPTQPTISALTLHYAHQYMIIPFSSGVLMGHLFWPQQVKAQDWKEDK